MRKLTLLLLLLPLSTHSATHSLTGAENAYMVFDGARDDYYTRDGLVQAWDPLDAGAGNDMLKGDGSFDKTPYANGGCTYCPGGWECSCPVALNEVYITTSISQHRYDGVHAVEFRAGAATVAYFSRALGQYPANAAYQINFNFLYSSATTSRNVIVTVSDTDSGQEYNFTTRAWGAAPQNATFSGITAAMWYPASVYLLNDATARNVKIVFTPDALGLAVFIDKLTIRRLNLEGPKTPTTNMTMVGSTQFTSNPDGFLHGSGSAPVYKWGTTFNGTTDYLTCTDANCGSWADPAGDFSFGCYKMLPTTGSATAPIAVKGASLATSGWHYGTNATPNTRVTITDAGAGTSFADSGGVTTSGAFAGSVFTYDYAADTTSTLKHYDAIGSVGTDAVAHGPIRNVAGAFNIGTNGATFFAGSIGRCAMWDRALSLTEAKQWLYPYIPDSTTGIAPVYVNACNNSAPPTVCSGSRCRVGRGAYCEPNPAGQQPFFKQQTVRVGNNSFETKTASDLSPTFTEWVSAINGNGTINAYRDDVYHGSISMRLRAWGITGQPNIISACQPNRAPTNLALSMYAKKISGTSNLRLIATTYTTVACTGAATYRELTLAGSTTHKTKDWTTGVDITPKWENYTGYTGTLVGVQSYKFYIFNDPGVIFDVLVDAVAIYENLSYAKFLPWVPVTSAAVPSTYTAHTMSVTNPLAQTVGGTPLYTAGHCVGGWFWDASGQCETGVMLEINKQGAGVNDNRTKLYANNVSCGMEFQVYDGADRLSSKSKAYATYAARGTANNWIYVEGCTKGATVQAHHWDTAAQTWYDWDTASVAAGFDGIMTAAAASANIGPYTLAEAPDGFLYRPFIAPFDGTNYSNTMFYKSVQVSDPLTHVVTSAQVPDLPPRPY